MTKKYIYGPGIDNPIVMINVSGTTETWYYYFTDALGSIRFITDDEGTIQESYTYDPFGKPYVMTGHGDGNWLTKDVLSFPYSPLGNPYMFTARRWDSSAYLYYYRFRDYQPSLGRFCQPDPIGYWGSMNLYQYCLNSPMNWLDPWGLASHEDHDEFGDDYFNYVWPDFGLGTHPFNIVTGTMHHFSSRDELRPYMRDAIWGQTKKLFELYGHGWQDSYYHYDKGYRWPLGHLGASAVSKKLV